MKRQVPWTDQEIEILTQMVQNGRSAFEVTQVLKSRTIASVHNKMEMLGLKVCKAPEIDLDAYAKLMKGESQCL